MNKDEIKAYRKAIKQTEKLLEKAKERYEKDKAKANQNFIIFKETECYYEDDIRDIYECDGCTYSEMNKALDRLENQLKQQDEIKTEAYYLIEIYSENIKDMRNELNYLLNEENEG